MSVHSHFLRLKQVKEMTCLSKSSIYRLMEEGDFPKQIPLGARSVVWVKSQVEEWCAQKVAAALG
jgi:prophage regulatory protein